MKLSDMRPEQLKDAVEKGVPALIAVGATKYHGPYLPIGTDIHIVSMLFDEITKLIEVVLLPPVFGSNTYWTGEEDDTDFIPDVIVAYVKEILKKVSAMGFKSINILQFHFGSYGLLHLAFKQAVAELLREESLSLGAGWGRTRENDWIFRKYRILDLDDVFRSVHEKYDKEGPFGQADTGETELMMIYNKKLVDLKTLAKADNDSNLGNAKDLDIERARRHIKYCAEWLALQIRT